MKTRQALRLLLPLFLVFAGLAPHSLPLHPDLGFLARFAPEHGHATPLRFDRPVDSALYLRPGAALLRKADTDRRQDWRVDTGDGLAATAPGLFLGTSYTAPTGSGVRRVRLSAPRFFQSRAPPFLAAA